MTWDDESTADPIADLLAWQKKILDDAGVLRPAMMLMSTKMYDDYLRYTKWREQTVMILENLPRRRFLSRMVLKRHLDGPLYKRYRPRWWYRLRELHRERTGWYDE